MRQVSEDEYLAAHGIRNVTPITAQPIAKRAFTAAELQHTDFPPIRWIVPDLLPEGLTLLAGKPKLGKSWLSLDLALSVAVGGRALGKECEQGAALYLALEDNPRRLQRRLRKIEPELKWPGALEFRTEFPRLDAGGLNLLRDWLKEHGDARLIIVDTLAVVRGNAKVSDSAHSSDYAALRGLHQIAGEFGIAVLVVHHLRKAGSEDPFDSVSGSTGLTGAADATLILSQTDGDVTLYGRGRDLEEIETALEFDAETCRWRDLGDPAEAFASDTRAAILSAIRGGSATPADVRDFTGLEHELVKKNMQRMARAGHLKKEAKGRYVIPLDPLSPPSPCPRSEASRDTGTGGTGLDRAMDVEERAAILEHDHGLSRDDAERKAKAVKP